MTSRNQEINFQNFCVKLAQLEICPDLRPQTGPTGGGDSKVDTENIPVSELTSNIHWQGIPGSGTERWGFAISAKKDWRTKVKSDVANIASTKRGYKQVFFITNQFARDKERSELEDNLTQQYGFGVTILDLNWLLDRVFKNNRLLLAIEELQLGEGLEEKIELGPLDIERQRQLAELSRIIEEAVSKKQVSFKVINSTLQAALLARGLGKPQSDVQGLFHRAIRMAEKYGSKEQLFTAYYHEAWTNYFWFEDYSSFLDSYDTLEELAKKSKNIFTAERQSNLCNLLLTLHQSGYDFKVNYVKKKKKGLQEILKQFIKDDTRPTASLHARAILVLLQLSDRKLEPVNIDDCFKEISIIMKHSTNLVGFPYSNLYTIIQELGDIYGDNRAYEKLLFDIIELDTKRKGEIPASLAYLNYGLQHLENNRIYKGIIMIGKSLIGLYKQESKEDLVKALYFLGLAYKQIGLMWAARGSLLNAAALATTDFWEYNDINTVQAKCIEKLKWIELQLGRVGYALEWQQTHHVLSMHLAKSEAEKENVFKEGFEFGATMGCLMIKTPQEKLSQLEDLPDVLIQMDLDFAAFPLMYLLGGEEYLPDEFKKLENVPDINEFFSNYLNQPAQKEIATEPYFYNDENILLESSIIGAVWRVFAPNLSPSIEIAENILASLEGFLATTTDMAIASRPIITIEIAVNSEQSELISFHSSSESEGNISIKHRDFNPHKMSVKEQGECGDKIREAVLHLVAHNLRFKNPEENLKQLFDESVMDRSSNFFKCHGNRR